ncbi:MAG: AEC family transporter [Pseudomonadota bacterium]
MENFVITISCLLIGLLIRRISAFPSETGNVLNLFVIYISLPALVLLKIPDLVFSKSLLVPALMPWLMLILSAISILFLSKLLKWDRPTTGCLLLVIPLGNTSFLGIPMVDSFFGEQAIPYAVLYDQLGSFLALATYGSVILAFYTSDKESPTAGIILKKIMSFPPFIAMTLAFFLTFVLKTSPYPTIVVNLLNILASTLVPIAMVAVGFQLTLKLKKEVISQLSIGLSIKLIIAPMVALFLCSIVELEGEAVKVSIFESAMPPMISAGALAIMANLAPKLAAGLVGIGIMLSFITLPILFQFL